jgi:hypothetical protein
VKSREPQPKQSATQPSPYGSNNSNGDSVSWDFTIEILEDSDGDGLPNELPGDYDPTNP